jgi:polyphosphate kinase
MKDIQPPQPEQLLNREMSWLEFNQRVLEQAQDETNPLLERVKFLAITGSNLDEFFMVRIGSLHILIGSKHERPDVTGYRPKQLLELAGERVRRLMANQYRCFTQLRTALETRGIVQLEVEQLSRSQLSYLREWFEQHVVTALSPLAVEGPDHFPLLAESELAIAIQIAWDPAKMLGGDWRLQMGDLPEAERPNHRFAILPLGGKLERFVTVPAEGGHGYVLLESLIKKFIGDFFPGQTLLDCVAFRITRNADMRVDEDGAFDLLHGMQEILAERKEGSCVRLEIEADAATSTREFLKTCLQIADLQVFEATGPLRLKDWMAIGGMTGFESLKFDVWPSQEAPHFRQIAVFLM